MDLSRLQKLFIALEKINRINLVCQPTPVRKLARAFPNGIVGCDVWIKDDSISHPVYGGNKPRKLEFLIAKAKSKKQGVVTFGFESSNHAVATAYHCAQLGVPCHLILVSGPEGLSPADEAMRLKKLAVVEKFATSIETVSQFQSAARRGVKVWLKGLGRIRIIAPGGSNALGTLGYVRGALELAGQIANGELPEPARIFVPLGTGGTAVGLALGLGALGLKTKVIAVKVVPGSVNELPRLKWLARQTVKLLPELGTEQASLSNLIIDSSALGQNYGVPTHEGLRAIDRWESLEDVKLEATYTGKAAAVLDRWQNRQDDEIGPSLFWLTYSPLSALS